VGGFHLYRRDKPDGTSFITSFDPESPAVLLPTAEWHSDQFDPLQYGIDINPSQPFFIQWKHLSLQTPRPTIMSDPSSENSDYALYSLCLKNCYFTYGGGWNENLIYCDECCYGKNCIDGTYDVRNEWCYETLLCLDCSHVAYSERCTACLNAVFCLGCKNCSDCFGCVNLQRRKFCFMNEQLDETAYRERLASIHLDDADEMDYWRKKIQEELWDKAYRNAYENHGSENAEGDQIVDSRFVFGFNIIQCERAYQINSIGLSRDITDSTLGTEMERSANSLNTAQSYDIKMCSYTVGCIDMEYCELCFNCEHCFGCIGLKRKKYCIANVQYTEEEYAKKVDDIKCAMLERGEYGDFFPYETSLFAYNASHADAEYPLGEEDVKKLGQRWYSFAQEKNAPAESIDALPKKLSETTDAILQKLFRCPVSGRAFRITKNELAFHRQFNLALPRLDPAVRRNRRQQAIPLHLNEQQCAACQKKVWTIYQPERRLALLCEACWAEKMEQGDLFFV